MRVSRSLEAVENQEAGHGRQRRGPTQARFSEEEGLEMDATRIVDQILARLGPELRQGRDPKRCPPTPGPQHVRSVQRKCPPLLQRNPPRTKVPRIKPRMLAVYGSEPIEKQRRATLMLQVQGIWTFHERLPEWRLLYRGT